MERQKRKLKGIADLYNIEDERQKRQPSSAENIASQNTPGQDITEKTIPQVQPAPSHIAQEDTFEENISSNLVNSSVLLPESSETSVESTENVSQQDIFSQDASQQNTFQETTSEKNSPKQDIAKQNTFTQNTSTAIAWSVELVDAGRGYFPIYNDITDRMIREMTLDVYEQSVLLKMYRESRGWKSEECEISHAEIVRSCNISKSQSQRTLAKLSSKGLIVNMGRSKSGPERNRFKVLPGLPVVPQKNIFREDISREEADVPQENKVSGQDISYANTNKNNNKELVNTHTQPGVGVGSKFTLEECRRFAENLQKTGQGINNPGGYATTIFRSGEFDAQIEAFLNPPNPSAALKADSCPDCSGSGYYYPEGVEKGVKICKHEKLKGAG
jgi:hypothetical protein